MPRVDLFAPEQIAGVFRGFREGGLEFHAELVLPYRNEFQSTPMHGQFLLVQLETPEEAVLGRITAFSADGRLSFGSGEDFAIRAVREHRAIPEDLREQYLKYRVEIRVLGVLRTHPDGSLRFLASHRRLPHVGSPVAFPSGAVLRAIAGHTLEGAAIGHFALGEYIYCKNSADASLLEGMQALEPEVLVRFPVENLVSRRSFIFARAGFGKSNLNKLLFSMLYEHTPSVEKRGGRRVPVGTVIFDPDGEYFWPDDKGRPGLCDVPHLADKLVVFTARKNRSRFYESFVAGGIKLDLRRLAPNDVIGIALSPERQDQQNVRKLRGLGQEQWERLVALADEYGHQAPLEEVCAILGIDAQRQEAEALAARANMATIVRTLHSQSSQLMDMLLEALRQGKLCVVDVSQLRGSQAMILAGLILRRIFDHNQQEFTEAESRTIPTIAVIEEAQSVLHETATSAEPFIAWIKEGRKYDLGAVLVTQQPGSIPTEILSQGDNWFIFHLLSAVDLLNVQKANAHFSQDILGALLNEPIPGQGVFWSSAGGQPYPVSLRVLSFERKFAPLDPHYERTGSATYATELRDRFVLPTLGTVTITAGDRELSIADLPSDPLRLAEHRAVQALRQDEAVRTRLYSEEGCPWGQITAFLEGHLPETFDDRHARAYHLVRPALDAILGARNWNTYKREGRAPGRSVTYVRAGRQP
jgi:DNA helicase HerA-like ATPase